jgi:hypothetical protein
LFRRLGHWRSAARGQCAIRSGIQNIVPNRTVHLKRLRGPKKRMQRLRFEAGRWTQRR